MKYLYIIWIVFICNNLLAKNVLDLPGNVSLVEVCRSNDTLFYLIDFRRDSCNGEVKAMSRISRMSVICSKLNGEIIWENILSPYGSFKSLGMKIEKNKKKIYVLARTQQIEQNRLLGSGSTVFCLDFAGVTVWAKNLNEVFDKMELNEHGIVLAGINYGKPGSTFICVLSYSGELISLNHQPNSNAQSPFYFFSITGNGHTCLVFNLLRNKYDKDYLEINTITNGKLSSFYQESSDKSILRVHKSLLIHSHHVIFLTSSIFIDTTQKGIPDFGMPDLNTEDEYWSEDQLVSLNVLRDGKKKSIVLDTVNSMQYGLLFLKGENYLVFYASTIGGYLMEVSAHGNILWKKEFKYETWREYEFVKTIIINKNSCILIGNKGNEYRNDKIFFREVSW